MPHHRALTGQERKFKQPGTTVQFSAEAAGGTSIRQCQQCNRNLTLIRITKQSNCFIEFVSAGLDPKPTVTSTSTRSINRRMSSFSLAPSDDLTPLGVCAISTYPALQSTERRRNMLSAQCSAALSQRQTVTIGETRENSGIEFPIGFTKTAMARLIVKHGGVLRRVANVDIANHDGSINLALVRSGSNAFGWHWDSTRSDFDTVEYDEPKPKTKRISIHTSGRINFHVTPNPGVNFIPCLLDLTEAVPVVAYVIPAVGALDLTEDIQAGDHIVELEDGLEGALGFEFWVIPSNLPALAGEIWRFIVEGQYGLACKAFPGALVPIRHGVPPESFSVIRPSSLLPEQAIPEDQAFIRFQELMHANQVRQALISSAIPEHVHDQLIEETVRVGRGIQGPNNQGVWEVVCTVPMRIRPELVVHFVDPRYRAEMIDMTSTDRRLEKVRVRFKVYDQQAQKWIKHPVEITEVFLNAEL